MAYKRKQDEMMNQLSGSAECSANESSQPMSVNSLSRKDLKAIVGNENSNFESSLGPHSRVAGDSTSQLSNHSSKMTSNIDSIYGFYKKKGADDDDVDNDDDTQNINEPSRNISNFENSANMTNYVPANQMLDLRLLNAEINANITP